jgi:hypothetical protein
MAFLERRKLTVTGRDAGEQSANTTHFIALASLPADVLALYTSIQACSATAMEHYADSFVFDDPSINPGFSAFDDVEDKALLEFQAQDGSPVKVSIPGPISTIFEADEETVDPLDAAIAALIVEVLGTVVTAGGRVVVEYVKGYRKRARARAPKVGVAA